MNSRINTHRKAAQSQPKPTENKGRGANKGQSNAPRTSKKGVPETLTPLAQRHIEQKSTTSTPSELTSSASHKTALKEALTNALKLLNDKDPNLVSDTDFDELLETLSSRSFEDQVAFIHGVKDRMQPVGWGTWLWEGGPFPGLKDRVVSFYQQGVKDINEIKEFTSILGHVAGNILAQAQTELIRIASKYSPPLPTVIDTHIQLIGEKVKNTVTSYKESKEETKNDAQQVTEKIRNYFETTSIEIAEFYSLEDRKLEILTDSMSQKFHDYITENVSMVFFGTSEFVISAVTDSLQKVISPQGLINLVIKIGLSTALTQEFGSREINFGSISDTPANSNIFPGPYTQTGSLTPMQIRIIVFCMMALIKGQKPGFTPTTAYFLTQGPFAFITQAGKSSIRATIAMLSEQTGLMTPAIKYLFTKLFEMFALKPVVQKAMLKSLQKAINLSGLSDIRLFSEKAPTFEEISNILIELPESLEAFSPEELTKFIEEIEKLPSEQKTQLFHRIGPKKLGNLPQEIQNLLFNLHEVLIHLPNKELLAFFGPDLQKLTSSEQENLFNEINRWSPKEKEDLLSKLLNANFFESKTKLSKRVLNLNKQLRSVLTGRTAAPTRSHK